MAQNRMTYQALLDQLQGADTDVLRRVLEHAMQRLIEAEAASARVRHCLGRRRLRGLAARRTRPLRAVYAATAAGRVMYK
jgi:phytoene/squalene synthetase